MKKFIQDFRKAWDHPVPIDVKRADELIMIAIATGIFTCWMVVL